MAIRISSLRLKSGEKGFIAGQNGTGKSYLSRQLLPDNSALAIIDPKGMYEYDHNIKSYDNVSKLIKSRSKRFIYRPNQSSIRDYGAYNDLLLHCYNLGNIFLYIDEIIPLLNRRTEPHDLQTCYQLGRQKGVTILTVSQRPKLIPGYLVSEAQKYFTFTLTKKADRDVIADSIGDYPLPRSRYEFVYKDLYSDDDPIRLIMPKGL